MKVGKILKFKLNIDHYENFFIIIAPIKVPKFSFVENKTSTSNIGKFLKPIKLTSFK